ncbi:hypothetical protein KAR91_06675 [Candidatus Pacearchaeota archaeon]|nr:hypothetical protein [Candidatus Pacearchaeota archaeon]
MTTQEKIEKFADSHETSTEIVKALAMANDIPVEENYLLWTEIQRIWQSPTIEEKSYVLDMAFIGKPKGTTLYWGEESFTR